MAGSIKGASAMHSNNNNKGREQKRIKRKGSKKGSER